MIRSHIRPRNLPGLSPVKGGADDESRAPTAPFGDAPDDLAEEELEEIYMEEEEKRRNERGTGTSLLRDALDISALLTDGANAMVDDSFLRCFTSQSADPWNWNYYLFPAWCLGVIVRYFFLLPVRLILLLISNLIIISIFLVVTSIVSPSPWRQAFELRIAQALCHCFLMSWSAVIKFHGPKPVPAVNRVWVANHSSMIDFGILCSNSPFAVIMQLQTGWVRFMQTKILASFGCLWFNRSDMKDRLLVAEGMKKHVSDPKAIPLLIFPEGTCVNNEYSVLFKRGAFDMGCTVCPVAIKYNKIFVDAFWNSKRQTFTNYMLRLMSSWAVVCDVWFLEPQNKREGESSDEFASRVQKMIADKAGLKIVPWDGYLKYYNLGEKNPGLIEKRRKVYADVVKKHLAAEGRDKKS